MRIAVAATVALAACSPGASPPADNASEPAAPTNASAAARPSGPVAGDRLVGAVSDLDADISGLNVRTSETQVVVDLPADTLFEFDRADLTPAASTNLGKVADLIRGAPAGTIAIVGYTDAKGDDSYNLALSERRAQAVVNWMREQVGVRQRAFQATGKGEADPVAPNARPDGADDPQGRAQNRRVVVSIPR